MKLSELYRYVFGNLAIVQPDERLNAEQKQKFIDTRQDKIRQAFASLLDSSLLRRSFITLLSALQTPSASALKLILYGEEQPEISPRELADIKNQYNDENIKQLFHEKNERFKYFSGEIQAQAEKDFVEFYKACKLTGDFVECNNDVRNTLASNLAYKMLVVIGASHKKRQSVFADIDTYLNAHSSRAENSKPVHDALVQSITVNDPPLKDLAGWRRFISKHGRKGLEYFQEAPAIEVALSGKAPKTKKEAEDAASQLIYARAKDYPELARLCKQYHIDETVFNQCLDIEKRRKQKDILPDVQLDGQKVGHPGYYLVKLPIDDPHAYILGKVTNCCQSIGGHSEKCVIDGVTREKNGFYVLLKGKPDRAPIQNGKIQYKAFKIVGQGYAWLSKKGNLVFDSWENLRPEADDDIIVPMLKQFAEEVTQQQNEILRVMIGKGGKTPAYYQNSFPYSEEIAEGHQYGDSSTQSLIYFNEVKCEALKNQLLEKWDLLNVSHWKTKEEFKTWLNALPISSYSEIQAMDTLFFHQGGADVWNSNNDWMTSKLNTPSDMSETLRLLSGVHISHQIENWYKTSSQIVKEPPILLDATDGQPGDITSALITLYDLLVTHAMQIQNIASALKNLYKLSPQLVNNENFTLLATHAHAERAMNGILLATETLSQVSPQLVTNENFALLVGHAELARDAADVLKILHEISFQLNNENFIWLVEHPQQARSIVRALKSLHKASSQLANNENFTLLANHTEQAWSIANALNLLHETSPDLVNNENRALLAAYPEQALNIARAIEILHHNAPNLMNDKNVTLLAHMKYYKWDIDDALKTLHKTSPQLVNNENFTLLVEHAEQAWSIANAINILYQNAPNLMNNRNVTLPAHIENQWRIGNENFILLAANAQRIKVIASELEDLHAISSQLMNNGNVNLLVEHVVSGRLSSILPTLKFLHETSPQLVNNENFTLLAEHAEQAWGIALALNLLHETSPDLVNNENRALLAAHPEQARNIANAIEILHHNAPNLMNDKNVTLLAHIENSWAIYSALKTLSKTSPQLANSENLALLVNHAKQATDIAKALTTLHETSFQLVNNENLALLAAHSGQERDITQALQTLHEISPDLVNNENCALLVAHPEQAWDIKQALQTLHEISPDLVNNDNRTLLLAHPRDEWSIIVQVLTILYQASLQLGNNKNQALHTNYVKQPLEFIETLQALYQASPQIQPLINSKEQVEDFTLLIAMLGVVSPQLVNHENFVSVAQHVEQKQGVASALRILYQASPQLVNQQTLKMLFLKSEEAEQVSSRVVDLYNEVRDPHIFSHIFSFFSNSTLSTPVAEKLKKYLTGDTSIYFKEEDKNALTAWESKTKNVIILDDLPTEKPGVEASESRLK